MSERISGSFRRRATWVLGLIFALLVGWLLAHRLSSRIPAPPWSASTLPTVPASAQNGLDDVVLGKPSESLTRPPPDLVSLVGPLENESPAERWAAIGRARAQVSSFIDAGGDHAARLRDRAKIDRALDAPRFADPCRPEHLSCQTSEAMNLARTDALISVDHALDGNWLDAIRRSTRLLRAAIDYVTSAANLLGNVIAVEMQRIAVDQLRVLLFGIAEQRERDPSPVASPDLVQALTALDAQLAAISPQRVDVKRAIVGECLWVREQLQYFLDHPGNGALPGGPMASFLIDRQRTIASSDSAFKELHGWVSTRGHEAHVPKPREYVTEPMWWIWNPGGKVMLDTLHVNYPALIRRLEAADRSLRQSRDVLQRQLRLLSSSSRDQSERIPHPSSE